ncbi:hypothetical protein [Parabacteroides faecis]|uniref:Uncharacterized protein n=1 Tax=Parabacteroides faecis TaxID=1217282 RepID=A0ABR6KLH2_9BACT|nr:hypothetical protein [Parabacteroides faecis]MBB4622234.1 hypothetical protein [Parabacteroides faecis]GGJ80365.1 hypothetical protein GCM10007084_00200 [Parabacteroides faecis]
MYSTLLFKKVKKLLLDNWYDKDCPDLGLKKNNHPDWGNINLEDVKDFRSLCPLIKEQFYTFCEKEILDGKIINLAPIEFKEHNIYFNTEVEKGYVLISKSKIEQEKDPTPIEIGGSATAIIRGYAHANLADNAYGSAFDNSVIRAYAYATIEAHNNASVHAFGNTNISAFDESCVRADSESWVECYHNTSVRAMCRARVKATGNSKLVLMGDAVADIFDERVTVKAEGKSYFTSNYKINWQLKERAIYRNLDTNTIYCADPNTTLICKKTDSQ